MPFSHFFRTVCPFRQIVFNTFARRVNEKRYLCTYVTELYMIIEDLGIVKRLIAEKEGGLVEFKETTGQLERGMETLCPF